MILYRKTAEIKEPDSYGRVNVPFLIYVSSSLSEPMRPTLHVSLCLFHVGVSAQLNKEVV